MKRYLFYICFAIVGIANAQQEQQYSQYMVNPYTVNPAVAGSEDYLDIKLGGRYQWVGLAGAPRTIYATVHTTLGKQYSHFKTKNLQNHWSAGGLYVYADNTGPITRSSAMLSYGYNFKLTKKLVFSTGAFFGVKQFSVDADKYRLADGNDPLESSFTKVVPDGAFGIWAYHKKYYFGLSGFQLLGNKISDASITKVDGNGKQYRHYFGVVGYRVMPDPRFKMIPSIMIKIVQPAPVSIDLNAKFIVDEKFFWGVSYRLRDGFQAMAGALLNKKLLISYSFDLSTTRLIKYNVGTHELVLGYRIHHSKQHCPDDFW